MFLKPQARCEVYICIQTPLNSPFHKAFIYIYRIYRINTYVHEFILNSRRYCVVVIQFMNYQFKIPRIQILIFGYVIEKYCTMACEHFLNALSKKTTCPIFMKFGMPIILVMGSICIVFGVWGTSNIEARGGPKMDKIADIKKYPLSYYEIVYNCSNRLDYHNIIFWG